MTLATGRFFQGHRLPLSSKKASYLAPPTPQIVAESGFRPGPSDTALSCPHNSLLLLQRHLPGTEASPPGANPEAGEHRLYGGKGQRKIHTFRKNFKRRREERGRKPSNVCLEPGVFTHFISFNQHRAVDLCSFCER